MKLLALRENVNTVNEMTIASEKSKTGKNVEWTNFEGIGHSVTVDGKPVHSGFVDRKSAARIYTKHLSDK